MSDNKILGFGLVTARRYRSLLAELRSAEVMLDEREAELAAQSEILREHQEAIQCGKADNDRLASEVQAATKKIAALTADTKDYQSLQSAYQSLEERLQVEIETASRHHKDADLFSQQARDRQEQIDREQAQKLEMLTRLSKIERAASEAETRIEILVQERDNLQARFDDLETEWEEKFQSQEDSHTDLTNRWNELKLPPMLITSMPKSGTYFISNYLADGLGARTVIVGNQYFPDDGVSWNSLREFAKGNVISQDHFSPSKLTLFHASRFVDRMVCHVRDPRQATLSWVKYIEEFNPTDAKTLIYPPLPEDYYERKLTARLDWAIDNWLPYLVEWTMAWLAEADQPDGLSIKITHFESMVRDEEQFFAEILDFFEIPRARFRKPQLVLDKALHFRAGEIDEWRSVFSQKQQDRASELISKDLAERMTWRIL